LFAVSAITVSCEKADPQDNHTGLIPDMAKQIESIITSKHHGRVFAPDLSAYNHIATTKAKPQQQYTTTDLLWDKAIFLSREDTKYTVVEIDGPNKTAIFSLYREDPLQLQSFKRPVKAFLIYKSDSANVNNLFRVVTMINLNGNQENPGVFNPVDLSEFIGFIIHSDIGGRFISINLYDGKLFHKLDLATPDHKNQALLYKLHFYSMVKTKSETTSEEGNYMDGGELEGAYCIADRDENDPPQDNEDADWLDLDGGGPDNMDDTSGGGGSGDQQGELTLTVALGATSGGHATGSGSYPWGGTVLIQAIPDLGCRFIQWTGDLVSFGSNPAFSLQLFISISATAVFHRDQPCRDANTADPLMNMALQGTPLNPINGGRFEALRVRTNKEGVRETYQHQGLDLRVEHDTPSYSILGGTVIGIRNMFDPNVPWSEYDEVYGHLGPNIYSAGNMITIRSYVNGNTIDIVYMHLNSVNGSLSIGSSIEPGTIIGVGGSTGAANSSSSGGPHLHLYVLKNGVKQDVEDYLYTKFDANANVTRSCNN